MSIRQKVINIASKKAGLDLLAVKNLQEIEKILAAWQEEGAGHLRIQSNVFSQWNCEYIFIQVELLGRVPEVIFSEEINLNLSNACEHLIASFNKALDERLNLSQDPIESSSLMD